MLEVEKVEFGYGNVDILEDICFETERSTLMSILGPNGVGKTTLLKCINGVLRKRRGTIMVENEDLQRLTRNEVAKRIGYVPQRADVSRVTVFDAVLLGRKPFIRWDVTDNDIDITARTIEALGLSDLSLAYTNEISGGEYQKVQIARALVQEPKVLLLDEPTSSLDLSNQHRIMSAVVELARAKSMSAVMTMHDLNLALRYSDRFVLMKGGRVFAMGGPEVITSSNVSQVYGIDVYVESVKGRPMVIPA